MLATCIYIIILTYNIHYVYTLPTTVMFSHRTIKPPLHPQTRTIALQMDIVHTLHSFILRPILYMAVHFNLSTAKKMDILYYTYPPFIHAGNSALYGRCSGLLALLIVYNRLPRTSVSYKNFCVVQEHLRLNSFSLHK